MGTWRWVVWMVLSSGGQGGELQPHTPTVSQQVCRCPNRSDGDLGPPTKYPGIVRVIYTDPSLLPTSWGPFLLSFTKLSFLNVYIPSALCTRNHSSLERIFCFVLFFNELLHKYSPASHVLFPLWRHMDGIFSFLGVPTQESLGTWPR